MKRFFSTVEPLLKAIWFLGLAYTSFVILRHWLKI
jgi:hypothetical protein